MSISLLTLANEGVSGSGTQLQIYICVCVCVWCSLGIHQWQG